MKKLWMIMLVILFPVMLMAQTVTGSTSFDFNAIFLTVAAFAAVLPLVVEFLKDKLNMQGLVAQIFSWVLGLILAMVGWWLQMGMFIDILWWQALLIGLGGSLVANGVFDTGIITAILQAIGIIKKK